MVRGQGTTCGSHCLQEIHCKLYNMVRPNFTQPIKAYLSAIVGAQARARQTVMSSGGSSIEVQEIFRHNKDHLQLFPLEEKYL